MVDRQGAFKERDYGKTFTFHTTTNPWALSHGLTYEYTSESGVVRFIRLLKTVVYVAVDENSDGTPCLEKWHIKQLWNKEVTK